MLLKKGCQKKALINGLMELECKLLTPDLWCLLPKEQGQFQKKKISLSIMLSLYFDVAFVVDTKVLSDSLHSLLL
jgi:arginine/lysine/ornithine decarboxylase